MEWAQVKSAIGWPYPCILCHHCPPHILQAGQIIDESFVIGWCLGFSFHSLKSAFLCQRDWSIGVKASSPHHLDLALFMELSGWQLSSAIGHHCQFSEGNLLFYHQPGLLEISTGPPLPMTQPDVAQSHHWKPCLVPKVSQFRFPLLHH